MRDAFKEEPRRLPWVSNWFALTEPTMWETVLLFGCPRTRFEIPWTRMSSCSTQSQVEFKLSRTPSVRPSVSQTRSWLPTVWSNSSSSNGVNFRCTNMHQNGSFAMSLLSGTQAWRSTTSPRASYFSKVLDCPTSSLRMSRSRSKATCLVLRKPSA